MKKYFFLAFLLAAFGLAHGQTRHPYYGGGHHTSNHGGHYDGGAGAHHKGGHYKNSNTYNTYGRHKRK